MSSKNISRRKLVRTLSVTAGLAGLAAFFNNCGQLLRSNLKIETPSSGEQPSSALPLTPPPDQAGFGQDSQAGTFANDLWVPGRNSQGKVNLCSWDLVPRNRWVTVEGTKLESLDAVVKEALPNWQDFGNERWGGVTNDWNGLTIDSEGSRAWLVAAGGHAGSSNNGIYGLDLFKMNWYVEKLPSDSSQWSAEYQHLRAPQSNSYSYCYESSLQQAQSPTNDWYWDELFWDRQPTSRHVYSATAYLPVTNEIIMSTRRLWKYSLTTKEWVYRRQLEDGIRPYDGAGTYAFYDKVANEYLHGGDADGIHNSIAFDLKSNSWKPWGCPWSYHAVADTQYGQTVVIFSPPYAPDSYYDSNAKYWKYDLTSRQVIDSGTVQFGSNLSRSEFPGGNNYYDGAGMCYIPHLNKYWVCTRLSDYSMPILELDPSTTPWTLKRQNFEGAVPAPYFELCRKIVFFPKLGDRGSVVMVDQASKNISLYKF